MNPDADGIDATIQGFLNFSFLLDYKLAPRPSRKAIVRRFLSIKTRPEALKYMQEVGVRSQTESESGNAERQPQARTRPVALNELGLSHRSIYLPGVELESYRR